MRTRKRMSACPPYGWQQSDSDKFWLEDMAEQKTIAKIKDLRVLMGYDLITQELTKQGIKPRGSKWYKMTIQRICEAN